MMGEPLARSDRDWPGLGLGDKPAWKIGDRVSLMLTYEGPLLTGNHRNASNQVKNAIRRALHPQLVAFCEADHYFGWLASPPSEGPTFAGIRFNSIVGGGPQRFVTELRVEILRREARGRIFDGGDIDGRMKTLFDGLRMPTQENEVVGFTPVGDWRRDWCLCLLADDRLITKVDIDTRRLLRPLRPGEAETDVELRIDVTINEP
jgi:hypothetical protein